jgi:hypothetical protein
MGYYIDTTQGRKGPYSADFIAQGIKDGTLQPDTRVVEEGTHRHMKAGQVAGGTASAQDTAPQDSSVAASPYQAPQRQPIRAPAPRPLNQTAHQPYPPAPGAYPPYPHAQSPHPYPGNAGVPYPGNPVAPQYQPYGSQQPQYAYPMVRPTSGWAIASLICSLVTFAVCLPTWIVGIIGGVIALKECEPNGPKQGRGLALAGLWTGVGIGFFYILGVVFWIAAVSGSLRGF